MSTIISIDPGASGGIAWIKNGYRGCGPMPHALPDLRDIFHTLLVDARDNAWPPPVAYIEDVPKFVGKAIPSSTTAVLFHNYGYIEGMLTYAGIRLVKVKPHDWQKYFRLGTKKECASTTEWKNKLKAEAMRRFPDQKVTLAVADALLILDYAIANEKGPAADSQHTPAPR